MSSFTFTNGLIMIVESDKEGEWWSALKWQQDQFIKAMRFGTMKSMGYPTPIEYSDKFVNNSAEYRFIIENDGVLVGLKILQNKEKRKIRYFELGNIYKIKFRQPTKKKYF